MTMTKNLHSNPSQQQQQTLRVDSVDSRSIAEAYHGGINAHELERHGLSLGQAVDFSSNILPHGPSPKVKDAVGRCELAAYPDRDCDELRSAIAGRLGIGAARILVGNGSSELIHLVARALIVPKENVLIIGPTFSEYERASQLASAQVIHYRSNESDQFAVDHQQITEQLLINRVQLVWLCNPNNPTGQIVEREIVLDWIRANPKTVFVVDESYIEFSSQAERLSLCQLDEPNLIVLRSMTKSFGMAGLRLGYAVLSQSHHRLLCSQRVPWSVSSIAQAAGVAALQDTEYYQRAIDETLATKTQLIADLASIGLEPVASFTNYFLVEFKEAQRVRELLLNEGLIVRDCTSFGLPNYLRIAALDTHNNRRLVQSIARILGRTDFDQDERVFEQNRPLDHSDTTQPTDGSQDTKWNDEFREQLDQLFRLRRDVRRFKTDQLPPGALERWISAACLAPSVGLSQPWKFVSVKDESRRAKVVHEFETQNVLAAEVYREAMSSSYRKLKLAGLKEAPEHLAVYVDPDPAQGHGLGRQTMPESVAYSVVAAIQNLWLAARSEGVGVGWVSILRPEALTEILDVPSQWRLIAYLCIGYPQETNTDTPELESLGWESRSELEQQWHQR
jgi:histidinol-phosphate aminotransferase/5,6-dimethylbenzimidazole synthase